MKKIRLLLGVGLCAATAATLAAQSPTWKEVTASDGTTYAINTDGSLWGWGWNEVGQLGIDSKTPEKTATPQRMGTANNWKTIAGGKGYAFFIDNDGALWAVGTNEFGVQGANDGATTHNVLTRIGTDSDWDFVAAAHFNEYVGIARKTDGTLWAWGRGNSGLLGDGTLKDSAPVPQQIGTDKDWKTVSIGATHVLALKEDGTLWGWGWNTHDCLMDAKDPKTGSSVVKTPVQLSTDTDWDIIFAVNEASYAIKKDGTLWTWGDNTENLLGLNSTADEDGEYPRVIQPAQITAVSGKVLAVSGCENTRTVGIGDGGAITAVYAWGSNRAGALGDGKATDATTVTYSYTPVKVLLPEGVTYTELSSGQLYSAVLASDGKIYGWGTNMAGQMGNYVSDAMLGFEPKPILMATHYEAGEGVYSFDAQNVPVKLADAKRIILTGEWTTADFAKITTALGNTAGFPPAGNSTLEVIDMSAVTFAPETSLYVTAGGSNVGAFKLCKALKQIIMPSDCSGLVNLREAFMTCTALEDIDISGCTDVRNISDAFYLTKITHADMSRWNEVTAAEDAFGKCADLVSISLPAKFKMSRYLFNSCTALETIDWTTYPDATCPTITPEMEVFEGISDAELAEITFKVPEAAYASFAADPIWSKLNVTSVAPNPGVYELTADKIPASLADARQLILKGEWATADFQKLTTAMGNNAGFPAAGNSTLELVDMTQATFAPATSLFVSTGLASKGTFFGCRALTQVLFPADAANLDNISGAFQNCTSLPEIDLTALTGLTSTTDAFYGCEAMVKAVLPGTFVFKSGTFENCSAMTDLDWSACTLQTAPDFVTNSLPTPASGNKKDLKITVPQTLVASFTADSFWNAYNIVGSGSGIDSVTVDQNSLRTVYDLGGRTRAVLLPGQNALTLPAGVYVITDGRNSQKVIVK